MKFLTLALFAEIVRKGVSFEKSQQRKQLTDLTSVLGRGKRTDSILKGCAGETEFSLCFECKGGFCGVTRSVFDIMCFIKNDAEKLDRV